MLRLLFAVLVTAFPLAALSIQEAKPPSALEDTGIEVSSGPAPGYVADDVCASCHPEIAESYLGLGMSRSFFRPRADRFIEDFQSNHYYHAPSRQHYEMVRRGDELWFRQYQMDAQGQPINAWERRVEWILGSGHRSRTYLYHNPGGELFQLPLAWYSQTGSWGMAPGFDNPEHLGVNRRVRRECMFCHNAYPRKPPETGEDPTDQTFPQVLPEGIGCQRCHGAGAQHVQLALKGEVDAESGATAIVNPGKLESRLRREICHQCHLQPAVSLSRLRRFGRHDYSFRPGEPLDEYLVFIDPHEEGQNRSDRFQINHHPYRLQQSPCYLKSNGRLECLDCHDPHAKPPLEQRLERYRRVCLSCHQESQVSARHSDAPASRDGACVDCHMPQRRAQDVVKVVMTDHRIQKPPAGRDLSAPLQETVPSVIGLDFLEPERAPKGTLGEIYKAVATLQAGSSSDATGHLRKSLRRLILPDWEPYLDLARVELHAARFRPAQAALNQILVRQPNLALAEEWLALCESGMGDRSRAIERLRKLAAGDSPRADTYFNLGRLLLATGAIEPATSQLQKALELRPNYADAWYVLGLALERQPDRDRALSAFRRALEIEPSHRLAYLRLGRLLLDMGRREEALRYLRHGAEFAAEPDEIRQELAKLQ